MRRKRSVKNEARRETSREQKFGEGSDDKWSLEQGLPGMEDGRFFDNLDDEKRCRPARPTMASPVRKVSS